jgi:hypothetical protein
MSRIVKQIDITIWGKDGEEQIAHFADVESLSHENGIFMVTLDRDEDQTEKYFYNSTNYIVKATYTHEDVWEEMLFELNPDPELH